jgi:hypothetical protein
MAAIVIVDPFTAVEQGPVEAIGADRIVKPAIISFHHVGEEITSDFLIGPTAAGSGAERREHDGCQY